jgi:hypothetical protein
MANEEKLPPEEELQKEAGIDPNGPPQPATGSNWVRGAVTAVGCLTVGGILFAVSGLTPGRTMGSTRSSKLKWEERDRQIEAAYQKDQAGAEVKPAELNEKDAAHE